MKLPRWVVIVLLAFSVLGMLSAAGWWWVTWPERTAVEFQRILSAGDWDGAEQMMADPPLTLYVITITNRTTAPEVAFVKVDSKQQISNILRSAPAPHIAPLTRSLFDLIRGEQEFSTTRDNTLTIKRGRIIGAYLTNEPDKNIVSLN